jgi:hypothetical protein
MLSKNSMFNVDESVNKNESSNEDPIMSNQPNEVEVKHDPFKFPNDNNILFSKLLFDSIVW